MKRRYLFAALLLSGSVIANAQTKPKTAPAVAKPAKPTLQPVKTNYTNLDSVSYSFGQKIAQGLKSDGVTNLSYQMLSKAMQDVFQGKELLVSDEKSSELIESFLKDVSKAKYKEVLDEGEKFMAENKKKAGVKTTPSGLQYEVLKAGDGAKPLANDMITVHYKGTLLNGKQFDSSYDRGEPINLNLGQVIPGWTEGVQLMPLGSKYKFVIPYQLAYGPNGAGRDIPPYSTLIFEIELIKIGADKDKEQE
ncbi:FKBP-type peptidyl-prolyl cis-trans isomerase [Pseudopedobacter beijingensis]|uniref:Peptidyl-prolyl cis-trans isomerase n=1 Tax=Pseudopedobacter beijingensis TaxID=1207056 RepID=A0ABW4IH42_9SPHI